MRADQNYCFRMLSLLLTFRKGFRKPSGTFRDAGFEHVTYGLYLRDKFGDQISLLTSPTYIPHENIEWFWAPPSRTPKEHKRALGPQMTCKLPGGFRKASGKLPGFLLTKF